MDSLGEMSVRPDDLDALIAESESRYWSSFGPPGAGLAVSWPPL